MNTSTNSEADTSGQINPVLNTKKGTERGQKVSLSTSSMKRKLPKTHADYWFSRLKKRNFSHHGKIVEIPDWQIRLKREGKEGWFNLGTPNQAAAAKKAREIYISLEANGWNETVAKFKNAGRPDTVCRVGEFLSEVKAVGGLKPGTFEIYARKFRTLIAEAFGIKGGKSKHDYVNQGYQQWLARVHSVRLDKLTPKRVNLWKVAKLGAAGDDQLQRKRASVTARSILLSSKSLFTSAIREHLTVKLPTPLPFDGVALPEQGNSRYRSEINPTLLLQAAKRELADGISPGVEQPCPRPELFKIVLLALGVGLRRDEIDKLQWKQIRWDSNTIRIERSESGGVKTDDSEADVDVDPGLLEILKSYLPKPGSGSQFIIESKVKPRPGSVRNHHYRCAKLFKELIRWLRGKGITARTALHSLRKEFGSQICHQAGIFAASVALRHSSITITRDHYLEKKQPVFLNLSKLMGESSEVEASTA